MARSLQDGAQLKVFVNGNPCEYITSISKTTEAGIQRIETLEGLAGFTNGSGQVTIELGYSVPIGGTEVDYDGICARKEYVDMQVFQGKKSYAGRGKFETSSVNQSVGGATEGTVSWTGELKAPE
jgi:hypothetical protein